MIKVAIHHRENSFSERWIEYCKQNNIKFIIVNAFETNIIAHLKEESITHFMWHVDHSSQKDLMVFPYVMNSLDEIGIKTFPNFNTRWHFDDKVAQKYILESIGAKLVPSYVFYNETLAYKNLSSVTYPIVAKLKRGAGATNVKLLKNQEEAVSYIQKIFSIGINPNAGTLGNLEQKIRIAKKIKKPLTLIKKTIAYFKKNNAELKINTNEKGYFYYQEFMPDNEYDTRVVVVGNKAIAIRRNNREGDYRASGSGNIKYNKELIDIKAIEIAFEVSNKLNTQSLAFDFVYDANKELKIIEVCFGFSMLAYDLCPGYWDESLNYHEEKLNLQFEMMRLFVK